MRKNFKLVCYAALAVVVSAIFFYVGVKSRSTRFDQIAVRVNPQSQGSPQDSQSPFGNRQSPGGDYEPSDPRWQEWERREKEDSSFQWKMPISFYGRVVDQGDNPIEGAQLRIVGTDASTQGNFHRDLVSDANGLVSLTGVKGKGFEVVISKPGYYTTRGNRRAFEYAAFWDPAYYEPDARRPVTFRLRKKGAVEPMIHREFEIKFPQGNSSEINLVGETRLSVTLLKNEPGRDRSWTARVDVVNGGFIPTTEEFAFEAPVDGYQSSLMIDTRTPKGPTWERLYEGGSFYVRADGNFGRVDIRMIPGKSWMRVDLFLNPSGSRNLEYDPAKEIKAH